MIRTRFVAAFGAMAVLVGACGSGNDDDTAAPGDDTVETAVECTEERIGGSVTFGAFSEPTGLDPIVALGGAVVGGIELTAIYDTLLRYDPETGDYSPHVAESFDHNEDFSEWTVVLPEGLQFSDGTAFDAAAVKSSVERHSSDANLTNSRNAVANIAEIAVVDPLTVKFTLTAGWPGFPFLLADRPGMITNPTAVEAAGDTFSTDVPPEAGIGAYEVMRFAPGEELVLRAKDDYWDGPVCIEELRFVVANGPAATLEAFQSGEFQAAFLSGPSQVAQAHEEGIAGFSNHISLSGILMINNGVGDSNPPTADVRVRQAIASAVDPDVINVRVNDGTAHPTNQIVAPESRREVSVEGPAFDPDRAADLVEEVKAEGGWDGSLRFFCQEDPTSVELCITVEGMLEAVGFDVTVTNYPVPEIARQVIVNQDYDIANWQWPLTEEALWLGMSQLHSKAANNRTGYSNPEMDAALGELRQAADVEEENVVLDRIQTIWNHTVPSVSYSALEELVIWSDSLKGVQPTANSTVFFDDAYLDS